MKRIHSVAALMLYLIALRSPVWAQTAHATTPEIFKQYSEHVVKIEVVEIGSAAKATVGTGFFADGRGRVVTYYHVISKLVHLTGSYRIVLNDVVRKSGDGR